MYCRNCSYEVSPLAIACPKCGVPPMKGNRFCFSCGASTDEKAIICVSCGMGLKQNSSDNINFIQSWSKYSYSTYIVILLFSLLPFINIKCIGNHVESITGLNMAIGAERQYNKTEAYTNVYGQESERYVTNTESLFSWDIALFYLTVIISLLLIAGTTSLNKFKSARNWTIASLILLAEWFLVISIRMNKYENRGVDFSFGLGFWLTALTTVVSLVLLSIYIKANPVNTIVEQSRFSKKQQYTGKQDWKIIGIILIGLAVYLLTFYLISIAQNKNN